MARTAKQRQLLQSLDEIVVRLSLDYWNLEDWDPTWRTSKLEQAIRWLVRGEIIHQYTLVDELLTCKICRYCFGNRPFPALWKTKRFQLFNYHVVEELSLMPKLRFVKAISSIPKGLAADIERLNALRNAMAHSFFPENLKRQKPTWKGKAVFTREGFTSFEDDIAEIHHHFREVFQEARKDAEARGPKRGRTRNAKSPPYATTPE